MRQLVVTGSFPFTSQTFVTREVASTFTAGHDVRVLAPTTGDAMGDEFCGQVGFPISRVTYRNYLRYPMMSANWRRFMPKVAHAGMREVYGFTLSERRKSFFADIVRLPWVRSAQLIHAHFAGWAYMVAVPLARILGLPVTVSAHEMDIPKIDPGSLTYVQRYSDAVTISSSIHMNRWKQLTGSDERLRLLYNGVDLSEFRSHGKSLAATERPLRIVTVSRLVPHKRVGDGIKAIGRLVKRGIDLEYRVVSDGPERASLEALINDLGVHDRVKLLGFLPRSEVIAELLSADMLLHPSEAEGFGVAVVEAMAAGLPVVVARSGGVEDIVEHGRWGYLYDPGDVDAIVERIAELAHDASLRALFGKAGQEVAETRFSWESHMAEMYALWEEVLQRHPRRKRP